MKEATYGCLGSLGSRGSLPGAASSLRAGRTCERHCFCSFPSTFAGWRSSVWDFGIPAKSPKCVHSYAARSLLPPKDDDDGSSRKHAAPRPPFGEQLPPQGPCLRRDERMLPKRLLETTTMEPMGRCLLQGPLSVQQMRERAYREDWRAAGTLWRLQECNRVGGDLSFRL